MVDIMDGLSYNHDMMKNKVLSLKLPHVVGSQGELRIRRSVLRDIEIRSMLHDHLVAIGLKRNPVLSDFYSAVYECCKMRVYLTHYQRETVLEMDTAN